MFLMQEPSSRPVGSYVATQVQVILGRQADVLQNGPDAVHATRVACRRLRSTLRTFHALWLTRHRGLRKDLRWYGRLLGAPRDTEVLEEGLVEIISTLDAPGLDLLESRLRRRLDADRDAGLDLLYEGMASARFTRLTNRLERLAGHVDWDELAEVPAVRLLPALAFGPVMQVALRAGRLPDAGDARLVQLHEVRKKAKAARYAYEAIGAPGTKEAATWKKVTESLGNVQDGHVGDGLLDELEAEAVAEGEPTAPYALLRDSLGRRMGDGEHEGLDALAKAVTEAP